MGNLPLAKWRILGAVGPFLTRSDMENGESFELSRSIPASCMNQRWVLYLEEIDEERELPNRVADFGSESPLRLLYVSVNQSAAQLEVAGPLYSAGKPMWHRVTEINGHCISGVEKPSRVGVDVNAAVATRMSKQGGQITYLA
jgi:hypothetical protein